LIVHNFELIVYNFELIVHSFELIVHNFELIVSNFEMFSRISSNISKEQTQLKTLEWDILNPDRLINLEINNKRRTSIINLEIITRGEQELLIWRLSKRGDQALISISTMLKFSARASDILHTTSTLYSYKNYIYCDFMLVIP